MNDPYTRKLQVMLNSARYLLAICVNILVLVLILYGVSRVCICGYHFCYAVFGTVTVDQGKGQEKIFQVETNRSMYEVADKLQKQGLIVDKYSFYARTQLLEQDTVILRPGTYVLRTNMDYQEIIDILTVSIQIGECNDCKRTFGDLFGFVDLADTGADAGIRAMGTAKRSADHTSFDAVIAFVYAASATTETCFRDRNGSGVFCSFNA